MCLSIPLRVLTVKGGKATIEGNTLVRLDMALRVTPGDYVTVLGGVAVGMLSKSEGARVRKYLRSLGSSI